MKFNWVKIDNGDWKCKLSNGDLLRVERMNRNYVWWCFYIMGNDNHCYYFDSFPKTIIEAKKEVEKYYQITLKSP